MPSARRAPRAAAARAAPTRPLAARVDAALGWLEAHGTRRTREGMARYAIPSDRAFGVTMFQLKLLAKQLGRDHELAAGLWATGWYEARMLATLIDEPERVTVGQMNRWCRDFDNWGICDTACFALFDRAPGAWGRLAPWAARPEEFIRRAAFALLWGLTVHDKRAPDSRYLSGLRLVERAATDERHFVKKAVNMALRAVGKRNAALHRAALVVARRLAEAADPAPRWVGKDALRELGSASVLKRVARAAGR